MEETATGRVIAARLKLLEELLSAFEAGSGLSLDDWRELAQEARRSSRKSPLRRAFRKRVLAAKRAWRPVRDLIERNGSLLRGLEGRSGAWYQTVPHAPPPKCARVREWTGWRSGPLTGLTAPRICWILCSSCVESARTVVLAMVERQRALLPMGNAAGVVGRASSTSGKNSRLYKKDGTLREGPYRILCALDTPRAKLADVARAARFKVVETVRAYSKAMRDERWIELTEQGWRRTPAGDIVRGGPTK